MSEQKKTRGQEIAADVAALLRARNPLLWIVTREEARVEQLLIGAAAAAGYITRFWDVGQGVTDMKGDDVNQRVSGSPDPGDTLRSIGGRARNVTSPERCVWVMRDLAGWLSGPGGMATQRILRNLARALPTTPRESAQAIVVLTPNADIPAELANHATVIEWPLPDREEIGALLDAAVEGGGDKIEPLNGKREAAIDAAVGLSGEEAQACYSKSLVQLRRIDPATVSREKKRVIARERVLEWFDPLPGGLDAVGGLENLKSWLTERASAYSPAARAYGLRAPKGAALVGIPGCGKSLTAKAVATAWQCPLLRLDMGALKSKFVGESEGNLRKALKVIEAIGRCVVWIDEIEKALAGATQGGADGGVSSDALGTILNWMQERQGEAFVIATANDVEKLPAELLRKGRFDEVFWIDLPTTAERAAIVAASLRTYGRGDAGVDLKAVARASNGFTGSEVAELIPSAMYTAFNDGARQITTQDLIDAAKIVAPLSSTMADKLAKLREWAKGKARLASLEETATAASNVRALDIA